MDSDSKTFQCELIAPKGNLLRCRSTSIVFPAHDGQVGVLYDHMPMLSQLGMGIVRVVQAPEAGHATPESPSEVTFLVDGGFALVAENSVTLIAYDALALRGVTTETMATLIDRTAKNVSDPSLSPAQRVHENARLRTLRKVAESLRP